MEYIPTPREVKKANYKIKCEYCGTIFFANKCTAKFCSTLCRVKFNKEHPGEQRKYVKKEDNNASQSVADEKPKEAPQPKKSKPKVKTTTQKKKVQQKPKEEPKKTFEDIIKSQYLNFICVDLDRPILEQDNYKILPKEIKDVVFNFYTTIDKEFLNEKITYNKNKYRITLVRNKDLSGGHISINLVVSKNEINP